MSECNASLPWRNGFLVGRPSWSTDAASSSSVLVNDSIKESVPKTSSLQVVDRATVYSTSLLCRYTVYSGRLLCRYKQEGRKGLQSHMTVWKFRIIRCGSLNSMTLSNVQFSEGRTSKEQKLFYRRSTSKSRWLSALLVKTWEHIKHLESRFANGVYLKKIEMDYGCLFVACSINKNFIDNSNSLRTPIFGILNPNSMELSTLTTILDVGCGVI